MSGLIRTIRRPYVDVRDYLGSEPTGTAADGVAIATAVAAAGARDVVLTKGTWGIDQRIRPPVGCVIRGEGTGTIAKRLGTGASRELFYLDRADTGIRDLKVSGNAAALGTHTSAEVVVAGDYAWAENVQIVDWDYHGFDLSGNFTRVKDCVIVGNASSDDGTDDRPSIYGIWSASASAVGQEITGGIIRDCYWSAIYIGGARVRVSDVYVLDCHRMHEVTGGGMVAFTGAGSHPGGHVVTNVVIDGAGLDDTNNKDTSGFEVTADRVRIDNCIVRNVTAYGIILQDGAGLRISDTSVRSNNRGVGHSFSGITVNPGVSGWSVIGCDSGDDQSSKTQPYGLEIKTGASDNYQIIGNDFRGNATGAYLNNGTGSNKRIVGNLPTSISDV